MSNQPIEFNTDDITIAQDGKVTISNPQFAKSLVAHLKATSPSSVGIFDNCNCSRGSQLRGIELKGKLPGTVLRLDPASAGIFDNCNCPRGGASSIQDV